MTDHLAAARDQIRCAQDQLRRLDDSVESPVHQLLVFAAAAVVHAAAAMVERRPSGLDSYGVFTDSRMDHIP